MTSEGIDVEVTAYAKDAYYRIMYAEPDDVAHCRVPASAFGA